MRLAIVHNAVRGASLPDEQDVLRQAEAVFHALLRLGHDPVYLPCDLNLDALKRRLKEIRPAAIFNLTESLDGDGRLIAVVPALLETMQIPFTGAPADVLIQTSHKVMAKERMRAAGLPTPDWIGPFPRDLPYRGETYTAGADQGEMRWLLKSLWEHASLGLEEDNLVRGNAATVAALLEHRAPDLGGACFAELYISGREFNLSLLEDAGEVRVLPPAEIVFDGYGEDKPRILGYRAKWVEDAYEYQHTERCFDFPAKDDTLLKELQRLAKECWRVFGLMGYARVDFRVDREGCPWILEVNANPCVSPDAGFSAAVARSGLAYEEAVERILQGCLRNEPSERHFSDGIRFSYKPRPEDVVRIRKMVKDTGFFNPAEIDVAAELVQERLNKGSASGYYFVLARQYGRLVGYGCYGPVPGTLSSYDIYWIAVSPDVQGQGLGKMILKEMERLSREAGGTRAYVETSMQPQYAGTRSFYECCGYDLESVLEDFYGPGDGKGIYCKKEI